MNDFPYLNTFMTQHDMELVFENLRDEYKPRFSTQPFKIKQLKHMDDYLKYRPRDTYLSIATQHDEYERYNIISNYYCENVRITYLIAYAKWTQMEYWINNCDYILKSSRNFFGNTNPKSLRETIYMNNPEVSPVKPTVSLALSRLFDLGSGLELFTGCCGSLIGFAAANISKITSVELNPLLHNEYPNLLRLLRKWSETEINLIQGSTLDVDYGSSQYDFMFIDPPFSDLHKYSNLAKDSITQFPNVDDWIDLFLIPSIKKPLPNLKNGAEVFVKMNDSKSFKKTEEIINKITNIGLRFDGCIGFGKSETIQPIWVWKNTSW